MLSFGFSINNINNICVPDDFSPDILQFAPVNVISTADCQDDWGWMNDLYICIRDDSGEHLYVIFSQYVYEESLSSGKNIMRCSLVCDF